MAAPLANSVKFRSLMDQLTKQEHKRFLNKLVDVNKGGLIVKLLFHYFTETKHKQNNSASQDLDNINGILCNIIQSRKKKPKPLSITNIKLNELPEPIIGYTASFLKQNDYFQLEKTNRSIFIGCNSPNMLIKLDLVLINDYSSINLSKFRSLKKLRINITKFSQFMLPKNGQLIMNNLNELWLDAAYQKDFPFDSFINQNSINMKNVKTLHLSAFGDIGAGNKFDINKFYVLLTKFPKVANLLLTNLFIFPHLFDVSKLKKIGLNLSGLSVYFGKKAVSNALVNEFGKNLRFLSYSYPSTTEDFNDINFSGLQQVLLKTNIKIIKNILQTGQNIQQFRLYPHYDRRNKTSLSQQELKIIIPQILKCKSLQYFEIEAKDQDFTAILEGIENGLFETIKWKRKFIKIRINVKAKINIKEKIVNIGRIILWLETAHIMDFMFILDMNRIDKEMRKQLDVAEICNYLNSMSSNIQISTDGLLFVIANKNCKMNGFGSSWMVSDTAFLRGSY